MITSEFNLTEYLLDYDCHVICEETSHEEMRELDADLPSDTHLCHYSINGIEYVTGIRAFKMSDIFDGLYDLGATVYEITQGYGRIKPKLFGYEPPAEKKKG